LGSSSLLSPILASSPSFSFFLHLFLFLLLSPAGYIETTEDRDWSALLSSSYTSATAKLPSSSSTTLSQSLKVLDYSSQQQDNNSNSNSNNNTTQSSRPQSRSLHPSSSAPSLPFGIPQLTGDKKQDEVSFLSLCCAVFLCFFLSILLSVSSVCLPLLFVCLLIFSSFWLRS
jgi:hypothetical protein